MTSFFGRFAGNVQRLATLQVQVEDNFQQASQRLGLFGNRLTSTSAIMTGTFVAAGAAVAGALVTLAQSAARAGDEVAKGSDQIGFAVEGYQRWAEVLELAGSNIDVLGRGIGTLQTAQEGALRGVESYTAQFEALNIQIQRANGELLTNQELVESIATSVLSDDAVSQQERLAIGRLFGARAGRQFAGALENIGSGERLQQQLASATVFFSDEQARAAEDFQDAMLLLNQQFRLATVSVGNELVPALTGLIETATPLVAPGAAALGSAFRSGGVSGAVGSLGGFLGGAIRDQFAGPEVVPVVRPDGTVVRQPIDTGGGEYGRFLNPAYNGRLATVTSAGVNEATADRQRETTDAIREGSALQLNAIQIMEQVNANLEVIPWGQMVEEIAAERTEAAANWAQGLGLLDAMVEIGNRQNTAAGLGAVNPFSQQAGRFAESIGAGTSSRFRAGVDIFRPGADATEAERLTRSLNFLRFSALAGRENREGIVQGFGIDASEQARILAERDRLLEEGFDVRQGQHGFEVTGQRGGGPGTLTVNVQVGDETITRVVDRSLERGGSTLLATQDDVYNVRTG